MQRRCNAEPFQDRKANACYSSLILYKFLKVAVPRAGHGNVKACQQSPKTLDKSRFSPSIESPAISRIVYITDKTRSIEFIKL